MRKLLEDETTMQEELHKFMEDINRVGIAAMDQAAMDVRVWHRFDMDACGTSGFQVACVSNWEATKYWIMQRDLSIDRVDEDVHISAPITDADEAFIEFLKAVCGGVPSDIGLRLPAMDEARERAMRELTEQQRERRLKAIRDAIETGPCRHIERANNGIAWDLGGHTVEYFPKSGTLYLYSTLCDLSLQSKYSRLGYSATEVGVSEDNIDLDITLHSDAQMSASYCPPGEMSSSGLAWEEDGRWYFRCGDHPGILVQRQHLNIHHVR